MGGNAFPVSTLLELLRLGLASWCEAPLTMMLGAIRSGVNQGTLQGEFESFMVGARGRPILGMRLGDCFRLK